MKIVAIIPVRGGSKSIPLKNIKLINGRPLVYWTIDAAINCKWIDEVYVSTDDARIIEVVNNYNLADMNKLKVIERSAYTATDTASTESVLLEFIDKVDSDYTVLLQATSPLTSAKHLDEAFQQLFDEKSDSLLTGVRQKRFIWQKTATGAEAVNYIPAQRPRRQEFDGFLVENGAFYISKTKKICESKVRISGKMSFYEMPEETYFEIDEPSDWIVIEKFLQAKEVKKLSKIKLFATDCDGVLTDGGMYYSASGEAMKKFNTKDGMGFELLRKKGIRTAILTGENSEPVLKRAEKIKTDDLFLGCKEKVAAMEQLLEKYQLNWNEIAYIGDDINDLALLQKVGMSFSVADALEEVKNAVMYVTERQGGQGAVREAIEYVLKKS